MNKKFLFGIVGIAIIVTLFFIFGSVTGNSVNEEVQHVNIGMKDWIYDPMIVYVDADKPVVITLDDSVRGCFRDLVIPELGVEKYFKSSEDELKVTFKEGSYTFACSMFMGQGRIVAK